MACYTGSAMPYHVEKRSNGPRPYKTIRSDTGKIVGSSTSRENAEASIRARLAAEHGAKLGGKRA